MSSLSPEMVTVTFSCCRDPYSGGNDGERIAQCLTPPSRTASGNYEFQSRWFGVGLVNESALSDPQLAAISSQLSAKILKTQELLKVKGAGWFKKLFKKIAKFFQKIFQAVVKVLIKIRNALQKFLQTGFGKVVGFIFGGPLILAALNIAINSFSYLAQGDIKGLFKYWSQNWLQIALVAASFALMFIPGLGQALAAGLKFLFQGLFAAVQFAVGAALQFIGSALSGLGSVLGSFAQGLGGFFRGAGSFLSQTGSRLVSQAQSSLKELFSNLKSAFSQVGESLKRSLGGYRPNAQPLPPHAGIEFSPLNLENIPAHPWITNHGLGFVAQETSKIAQKSLLQRVTDYVNKFSLSFIQQKIDQKLEKSKMNSFVKSLLGFFTGAALGAVTGALISSAAQTLAPALGSVTKLLGQGLNALYQGGKAILSTLGRGIQFVGQKIGQAFDATKSFFSNLDQRIFGARAPPVNAPSYDGRNLLDPLDNARISFGEGALPGEKIGWTYDGTGDPHQLIRGPQSFDLSKLDSTTFRADTGEGNFTYFKNALKAGETPLIENVGNLRVRDEIPLSQKFINRAIQERDYQGAIDAAARLHGFETKPFEIKAFNFKAFGKDFSYKSLRYDPYFEGLKDDPFYPYLNPNSTFAVTRSSTGEIFFGQLTFKGPTSLQATVFHELIHQNDAFRSRRIMSKLDSVQAEIDTSAETLFYADRLGLAPEDIKDELDYLITNMEKRGRLHRWLT